MWFLADFCAFRVLLLRAFLTPVSLIIVHIHLIKEYFSINIFRYIVDGRKVVRDVLRTIRRQVHGHPDTSAVALILPDNAVHQFLNSPSVHDQMAFQRIPRPQTVSRNAKSYGVTAPFAT